MKRQERVKIQMQSKEQSEYEGGGLQVGRNSGSIPPPPFHPRESHRDEEESLCTI